MFFFGCGRKWSHYGAVADATPVWRQHGNHRCVFDDRGRIFVMLALLLIRLVDFIGSKGINKFSIDPDNVHMVEIEKEARRVRTSELTILFILKDSSREWMEFLEKELTWAD